MPDTELLLPITDCGIPLVIQADGSALGRYEHPKGGHCGDCVYKCINGRYILDSIDSNRDCIEGLAPVPRKEQQ